MSTRRGGVLSPSTSTASRTIGQAAPGSLPTSLRVPGRASGYRMPDRRTTASPRSAQLRTPPRNTGRGSHAYASSTRTPRVPLGYSGPQSGSAARSWLRPSPRKSGGGARHGERPHLGLLQNLRAPRARTTDYACRVGDRRQRAQGPRLTDSVRVRAAPDRQRRTCAREETRWFRLRGR